MSMIRHDGVSFLMDALEILWDLFDLGWLNHELSGISRPTFGLNYRSVSLCSLSGVRRRA